MANSVQLEIEEWAWTSKAPVQSGGTASKIYCWQQRKRYFTHSLELFFSDNKVSTSSTYKREKKDAKEEKRVNFSLTWMIMAIKYKIRKMLQVASRSLVCGTCDKRTCKSVFWKREEWKWKSCVTWKFMISRRFPVGRNEFHCLSVRWKLEEYNIWG